MLPARHRRRPVRRDPLPAGIRPARGARRAAADQAWLPAVALFPLAILLFPEGRLPSPRWRWVLWSYLGLCGVLLAVVVAGALPVMLDGRIRVDASGQFLVFDHSSGGYPDPVAGFRRFRRLLAGLRGRPGAGLAACPR